MKFQTSVFVAGQVADVFEFAIEQVRSAHWQWYTSVKHLTGEVNAPSSTYQRDAIIDGHRYIHSYVLSVVDPPYRFEARSTKGTPGFMYAYSFAPEADGTRVTVDVDSTSLSEARSVIDNRLAFFKLVFEDTERRTRVIRGQPEQRGWEKTKQLAFQVGVLVFVFVTIGLALMFSGMGG